MWLRRSGRSLKAFATQHPETRADLQRVLAVVHDSMPGALIDPNVVAAMTNMSPLASMGYLEALHKAGAGHFVVRVVDQEGNELRRFPDVESVPSLVEDDFGDIHRITPELIDIAFEPERSAVEREWKELAAQ